MSDSGTTVSDPMPASSSSTTAEDGGVSPLSKFLKLSVSPDSGCDRDSMSSPVLTSDDSLSDSSSSRSGDMKFWRVSVRSKTSRVNNAAPDHLQSSSSTVDQRQKTIHQDAYERHVTSEPKSSGTFYEARHQRVPKSSVNNLHLLSRGTFGQVSISSSSPWRGWRAAACLNCVFLFCRILNGQLLFLRSLRN